MALFVIVLAAAEAAVALAIALNFYNNHATIDVDRADESEGLTDETMEAMIPTLFGLGRLIAFAVVCRDSAGRPPNG